MRSILLLAVAIIALIVIGACTKQAENSPSGTSDTVANGEQTPPDSNGLTPGTGQEPLSVSGDESGRTMLRPPDAAGRTGITTTGQIPEQWPATIPVMEGLKVGPSAKIDGPPLIINIGLHGNVPVDDVQAFYTSLEGWERNPNLPWNVTGRERQFNLKHGEHEFVGVTIQNETGETKVLFVYTNDAG